MGENNKEMIQNFGDMVNATERLAKPWQDECERWKQTMEKKTKHHTIRMIATNLFWMIVTAMLIWFAYMTPIDADQEQNFNDQAQHQSYSEGVTDGD